ncbi:hypothetical protein ACFYOG_35475 [Streptomyces sp. NPDC007818]|uniref:hypothetical protein n=1 Tax=Streptomyces sp. NPDC007818 TaxID=3364780 RepID=UPI00368B8CEC
MAPAADAGPGLWSRTAVESTDAEAVRASLPGTLDAYRAAERLTAALGDPLPRCRPRVTPAAIGHLTAAGLLAHLAGEPVHPAVNPDQVAALARRRDLPALLDRHVPLGPDQAARGAYWELPPAGPAPLAGRGGAPGAGWIGMVAASGSVGGLCQRLPLR